MQLLINYQLSSKTVTPHSYFSFTVDRFISRKESNFCLIPIITSNRNNNNVIPCFSYAAWNVSNTQKCFSHCQLLRMILEQKYSSFLSRGVVSTYYATHIHLKLRSDRIFHSSLSFAESRNVRSFHSKFLLLENQKFPEAVARTRVQARRRYVSGIFPVPRYVRFCATNKIPQTFRAKVPTDTIRGFPAKHSFQKLFPAYQRY